jgi:transcription antitermination factor NusG
LAIKAEKIWYPVYTRARAEKKVYAWLTKHGIECYLPLKKVLRQWSDRKKWVNSPLFSSYVFVKIDMIEYTEVLNTPGVARFVWFEGRPVSIPEKQIILIQPLLEGDIDLESVEEKFLQGDEVTIDYGPMKGITGELIDYRGKKRILIRINEIGKNLVIEVPLSHIKKSA